jgi:hypothetical protein
MSNIKHLVDWRTKIQIRKQKDVRINYPYYKCNHAVGVANPNKIAMGKEKVTCKNCLKWYGKTNN